MPKLSKRQKLMTAPVAIYALLIFIFEPTPFFSGFFLMALLLLSTEKKSAKTIALILSPLLTYPLYLSSTHHIHNFLDLPETAFYYTIYYLIIYAIIYALVLRKIHKKIPLKDLKTYKYSISILTTIVFIYGNLQLTCYNINSMEKGPSSYEKGVCAFFNQNLSGDLSGKFSALPQYFMLVGSFTTFVISLLLTIIVFFSKNSRLSK